MIAGGTEAPLTLGTLKAWEALRTLASEDPVDPALRHPVEPEAPRRDPAQPLGLDRCLDGDDLLELLEDQTTGIGVVTLLNREPADVYRATRSYVIESRLPADAALAPTAFRLEWTPGPEGSRYEVRVTTDDLRVITTMSDLTAPELVVRPEALSGLAPGTHLLWQVEASLPDGERVMSRTFMTRVE